jgi:hypothetical protein
VGELSLTECAQRNGVATDALDVGLDESGALAAADPAAGQALIPQPPPEALAPEPEPGSPEDVGPAQTLTVPAGAACWRHAGGRWRRVGEMSFDACVQTLFAGTCEKGAATYGRYGAQTLRRVPGKVEVADDNRTFRTLAPQTAPDCVIAPLG